MHRNYKKDERITKEIINKNVKSKKKNCKPDNNTPRPSP